LDEPSSDGERESDAESPARVLFSSAASVAASALGSVAASAGKETGWGAVSSFQQPIKVVDANAESSSSRGCPKRIMMTVSSLVFRKLLVRER
jgi:hypothetical protein